MQMTTIEVMINGAWMYQSITNLQPGQSQMHLRKFIGSSCCLYTALIFLPSHDRKPHMAVNDSYDWDLDRMWNDFLSANEDLLLDDTRIATMYLFNKYV